MIDIFVQLVLGLNKILFNNLGLTIIVIGVASRAIFHPFLAQNLRYSKAMRELKPRLDEIKRKHGADMRRVASEQSRLFREAGVGPAAGAVGCLSMLVQLVVFILLFQSLTKVIASGVETDFLFWNLAKPDTFKVAWFPTAVPGLLVLLTAVFSFIQTKMVVPAGSPKTQSSKKGAEQKPDLAEALAASQGQMAYFMPVIIIIWGIKFAAGLILYWLISTLFAIIQQYAVSGAGGLKPWLEKLSPTR